ncbi:hypothetical protein PVB08_22315 [Bacillus thuringiensis]
MALPRNTEYANKLMRSAAVERLRTFGIHMNKHYRSPLAIARKIQEISPELHSDDPMVIIRAWVSLKADAVVPGRLAWGTGQPYVLDSQMRYAQARLQAMRMPAPVNMSSRVLYSPDFA